MGMLRRVRLCAAALALAAGCGGGGDVGEPTCSEMVAMCVDGTEPAQCDNGDTTYTPAPCGTRRWVTVNCFTVDGERRCNAAGCFSRPEPMAVCAADGTVTCEGGGEPRCTCSTPPPTMEDCVRESGRCVEQAQSMTEMSVECEF